MSKAEKKVITTEEELEDMDYDEELEETLDLESLLVDGEGKNIAENLADIKACMDKLNKILYKMLTLLESKK